MCNSRPIGPVLFCRCENADFLSGADRQRVQEALAGRGIEVSSNGDAVTGEEVGRRKVEAVQERLKEGDIHSILATRKLRAKQRKLGAE